MPRFADMPAFASVEGVSARARAAGLRGGVRPALIQDAEASSMINGQNRRPSNRDVSAGGEPSLRAGPQAEALHAGIGSRTLAGCEGHSRAEAGSLLRGQPPTPIIEQIQLRSRARPARSPLTSAPRSRREVALSHRAFLPDCRGFGPGLFPRVGALARRLDVRQPIKLLLIHRGLRPSVHQSTDEVCTCAKSFCEAAP